ncbi:hypothetical protein [Azovibrio restrictus]|nr:hypothetical protein [Azovibrio restrictus]
MLTLRNISFWIAALVLPGGFLLLVPKAIQAVQRLRGKGVWFAR